MPDDPEITTTKLNDISITTDEYGNLWILDHLRSQTVDITRQDDQYVLMELLMKKFQINVVDSDEHDADLRLIAAKLFAKANLIIIDQIREETGTFVK